MCIGFGKHGLSIIIRTKAILFLAPNKFYEWFYKYTNILDKIAEKVQRPYTMVCTVTRA